MPQPIVTSPNNRRHFLKLSAVGTGLLFAAPLAFAFDDYASELNLTKKMYRGTYDGRILVSTDGGATWEQSVNFGKKYTVEKLLSQGNGKIKARLRDKKVHFWVQSKDDIKWFAK